MANRQRLTWNDTGASKEAAAPPQIPSVGRTEDPVHPAHKDDPEVGDYDHDNPEAWLDVVDRRKPVRGAPPAIPGGTDSSEHPAAMVRKAEVLASKCLRIASAMLSPAKFEDEVSYESALNEQAFGLMSLASSDVDAMLSRMQLPVDVDFDKEAATGREAGLDSRISSIEEKLDLLLGRQAGSELDACGDMDHDMMGMDDGMLGMDDDMMGIGDDDEELEAMLADDSQGRDMNDPEYGFDMSAAVEGLDPETARMLTEMVEEQQRLASSEEEEEEEDEDEDEAGDKKANPALAQMFRKKKKKASEGGKDEDEDKDEDGDKDEDEHEDEHAKEASTETVVTPEGAVPSAIHVAFDTSATSDDVFFQDTTLDPLRMASTQAPAAEVTHATDPLAALVGNSYETPRPQPKLASNGISHLGPVVKSASAASSEVSLSDLWPTAPDVSKYFPQ